MARKALLTVSDCKKIRALHEGSVRALDLAKKFGVSESSLYKVLDGSYKARANGDQKQDIPVVKPDKPEGITPSLFERSARCLNQEIHPVLQQMVEKATHIDDVELDDLTIAAAELIVAKARLNRALAHVH